MKCFLISWTLPMCFFRLLFLEKLWSQMSHLNDFFALWTEAMCLVKLSFLHELLSYAFSIFWLHKDIHIFSSFHEYQQYVSLNWSLQKNLVTNITFEWVVRIVDRSSVFWQIALLRKTSVTNVTFEWFLSLFMFFENMFFQSLLLRAVKEQIYCFLNKKFTQIWRGKLSLPKIISLHDPG